MRSPHSRTRTLGARDRPRRRKARHWTACVRVCLAATGCDRAELPGPRGLTAPRRCVGCGRSARRGASRWRKAPARPGSARLCPTCPGALVRARGRERKALPLGLTVRPGCGAREGRGARGAQLWLRRAGSPQPRARPRQPLLRNFFFLVRPTRKVRPERGRWAGRARGGDRRGGSGARGSAAGQRKCPARPAPARRPAHPGPPPRCDFGGPSPERQCWRRRRQMWPGCPEEPTMRGRQNKRVPLLLLSRL